MRMQRPLIALTGIALALLLAGCGGSSASDAPSETVAATAATAAGAPAAAAAPGDVAFAQMMLPHHMQAIQMSNRALMNSSSPEVKALAEQILAAQDPEIATMSQWLLDWGVPEEAAGDDHSGHGEGEADDAAHGMMDQEDLNTLYATTGPAFDRMWLGMMIAHHEGAVAMAQDVLATTSDSRVRDLAQSVIDGQTAEIEAMRGMLTD